MRGRLILEWLMLLSFACVLAVWSLTSGVSSRLDYALLDFSTSLIERDLNEDITIVEIDDGSLATIGRWPWPRTAHAELIDQLSAAGARLIIMDVLFFEETVPLHDDQLARAIQDAGNVILPVSFTTALDGSGKRIAIEPIEKLSTHARTLGHVALKLDSDGIFRRSELQLEDEDTGESIPHMMVAAYQAAFGVSPPRLSQITASDDWPLLKVQRIGHFKTVPASAVITGSIGPDFIKDRIILVGATAQGLGDSFPVSSRAGSIMNGVEIQANLLDSLVSDQFVSPVNQSITISLTLGVIVLMFLAFWKLPPQFTLFLVGLLVLALLTLSVIGSAVLGWWFPPGSALLALIISYPLWAWRRLESVSSFLDKQAFSLADVSHHIPDRGGGGFDFVARQVDRMQGLLIEISERFSFIRNVIEAAPDAIIVLDEHSVVTMKNRKAADMFGPEEDLQYLPEMLSLFGASLDMEKNELNLPDGRNFLVAKGPLQAIAGPENKQSGQIMVLRNVTDLKRKEAERQELLEFISHDMRTPQVAIIGLSNKDASIASPDERFDRIKQQAKRTLKLADDFVHLARLSEAPVEKEDVDLCALVTEAADRAYLLAKRKAIEIIQTIPDHPIFITADASLLARVLDNLIGNALKFSPEKSTINLVVIDALDGEEFVTLSVADEGPGLPPERQADPFARFGAHDAAAGPSVGLGLAFVEMAVKGHSGTITVETKAQAGTKFTIKLPAEQLG